MSNPLARKPSNLFLTEERVVAIMDFGLAKMVEEVRRASTIIGGTPNYMAPEQAVGDPTDHRGDLYALGGTLFHLITGTVPCPGGRCGPAGVPQVFFVEEIGETARGSRAGHCRELSKVFAVSLPKNPLDPVRGADAPALCR
jgi:serine/threonine protein kinase